MDLHRHSKINSLKAPAFRQDTFVAVEDAIMYYVWPQNVAYGFTVYL